MWGAHTHMQTSHTSKEKNISTCALDVCLHIVRSDQFQADIHPGALWFFAGLRPENWVRSVHGECKSSWSHLDTDYKPKVKLCPVATKNHKVWINRKKISSIYDSREQELFITAHRCPLPTAHCCPLPTASERPTYTLCWVSQACL